MDEEINPWSVKGVPKDARAAMNAAARRANVPLGEWLQSAALLAIERERGHLPPVPAGPPGMPEPSPAILPSLAVVVQLSAALPGLTGEAGSKRLAGLARRVIAEHLRLLLPSEPAPAATARIASGTAHPDPGAQAS